MKSLGQIAYEAYAEKRCWKVFSGDPMPSWSEQSPELRDAWRAGAEAVARETCRRLLEPLAAGA